MTLKTLPKESRKEPGRAEVKECVHYWLIEPPEGPVSMGVCRLCGARQEFKNFSPYSTWDNETTAAAGHRRNSGWDFDFEAEVL